MLRSLPRRNTDHRRRSLVTNFLYQIRHDETKRDGKGESSLDRTGLAVAEERRWHAGARQVKPMPPCLSVRNKESPVHITAYTE